MRLPLLILLATIALATTAAACGDAEEVSPATQGTVTDAATPSSAAPLPTTPTVGKAPDGCLTGELAYSDPAGRFAFCYPNDMELVVVDSGQGPGPTVRHRESEKNRVSVTFGSWAAGKRSASGEICVDSPHLIQNRRHGQLVIGGAAVDACFQDLYERDKAGSASYLLYRAVAVEIPVATGFMYIDSTYSGPEWQRAGTPVEQIMTRVLDSAVIG